MVKSLSALCTLFCSPLGIADKGSKATRANILSWVVSIFLGVATHFAFKFILTRMAAIKNDVIYQRRKDRQMKDAFGSSDEALMPRYKANDSAMGTTISLDHWRQKNQAVMGSSQTVSTIGQPVENAIHAPQPVRVSPAGSDAYDRV